PPPPSPPPPCKVCVYFTLTATPSVIFPFSIPASDCQTYLDTVKPQVTDAATQAGARMLSAPELVTCSASQVKICSTFFSSADGAKLQSFFDSQVQFWLEQIATPASCSSYLLGYQAEMTVGGDGSDVKNLPTGCVSAYASQQCAQSKINFPACVCNTKPLASPFAALPTLTTLPGRFKSTTLWCFTLATVTPSSPTSTCGKTTTLAKAEIWANDNLRRKIAGIGLKPAGSATMRYISASWGAVGENTLKATPLNWSKAQANGGQICLELENNTSPAEFCNTGSDDTCWINLFDTSKSCCPLYSSTDL
ncbi:hypothetical protein Agub_g12688, partial [Astrephomene gubernaculifera]